DLIAKGPKSKEVLDLFQSDRRFSSVAGNHDLARVKYWLGEEVSLKRVQKEAYNELQNSDGSYLSFLSNLPFTIDLGTHIVVHAGLRPGVPLPKQDPKDLTELRTLGEDRTAREGVPWYEVYEGPKSAL